MPLDIDELRGTTRRICGIDEDDPDGTDTAIDICLNRSFWEIMNKFNFRENERTATFNTIAFEPRYQLPVIFEAVQNVAVQDPITLQWFDVNRMSRYQYDKLLNDTVPQVANGVEQQAMPAFYYREDNAIILWPTPSQVFPIKIRHLITLSDLSDANDIPVIPQVWHEIILYGGVYRTLYNMGDFNRAETMKSQTITMMTSAVPVESKEERNSQMSGGNIGPARGGYMKGYQAQLRYGTGGLWNGNVNGGTIEP